MKLRPLAALVAALALLATGCSSNVAPTAKPTSTTTPATSAPGKLIVFAAASLKAPFTEMAKELGKDVTFSFEGSSTLVDQIKNGAPADVFASADTKNMTKGTDAKVVGTPKNFATNKLTLIVPKGNPGQITGLDKSLDGKKLVICAPEVPCGNATKTLAEKLNVTLKPVSQEMKVTDVLGKVSSGEADAGLVYVTDAAGAKDKVEVVTVPGSEQVINTYPIALVSATKHQAEAQAFIDFVLSDKGQAILAKYGFQKA